MQEEKVPNPDESKLNLEHILPQRPSEGWRQAFSEVDESEYVHRLGNLTLLMGKKNRQAANRPFKEKRDEFYSKSELPMTKELCAWEQWTPKAIDKRQGAMGKLAAQVWRVDF